MLRLVQLRLDVRANHPPRPEAVPLVPQRVGKRLAAETLERVVAEHVAGAPTTTLSRYGIGDGTVISIQARVSPSSAERGRR
jgi:hypothetical protein